MRFINERFWFEPHGQDFVFRESAFSRGYLLTGTEKAPLLAALRKFQLRAFIEALGLMLLAGIIAATRASGPEQIPLHMLLGAILAIVIYAPISMLRQHRMVDRLLAGKVASFDPPTFRQAMQQPRPMIKKKHAIRLIGLSRFLFVLGLGVVNLLLLRAFLSPAWRSFNDGDGGSALAAMLATLDFWLLLAAVNAPFVVLYAGLALIHRHWRSLPDDY